MKIWMLVLSLAFIVGQSASGHTSDGNAPLRTMAKAIQAAGGHATLLVEEDPNGAPKEVILAAGQIEGQDPSVPAPDDYTLGDEPVLIPTANDSIFQFARGGYGAIYTLFMGAGGFVGLSIANVLEVGIDGGGVGSFGVGLYVGPYVKLAPVPYKAGKRVYLHGRIYRAWLFGPDGGQSATLDLAEVGVGYRHMTDAAMAKGEFWHVEGGLMMDLACPEGMGSCKVADDFAIPTIRFGINFR